MAYVIKNTPSYLPVLSKFMQNYIKALFGSTLIKDAFDLLDSCFNGDIKLEAKVVNPTLVENSPLTIPLLEFSHEGWVNEDSLFFLFKDFCSVAGLVYKPEYNEAILRSMVCKDLSFCLWLFREFLDIPVVTFELMRSAGENVFVTDAGGLSDNGVFTDSAARGYLTFVMHVDMEHKEDALQKVNFYKDLIAFVLPARLLINFYFV